MFICEMLCKRIIFFSLCNLTYGKYTTLVSFAKMLKYIQRGIMNINKYDADFLIECIRSGKDIPVEYKYALFPTKQKEYELIYSGKMRKEDIIADNEEAKAVPLQVEKLFNGEKHPSLSADWRNMLVFGDN